ncbi:MAG: putative Rdd family protein [Chloroflexi bacterium]|nr:putative Rdd family protein [Chloroflexota bacterium]
MKTYCSFCGIANASDVTACFACGTTLDKPAATPPASNGASTTNIIHPYSMPLPRGPQANGADYPVGTSTPWPVAGHANYGRPAPPGAPYPAMPGQPTQDRGAGNYASGQLNGGYPAQYIPIPPVSSQASNRSGEPIGAYQPAMGGRMVPYTGPYDPMGYSYPDTYAVGPAAHFVPYPLADVGIRLGAYILDCIALAVPLFVLVGIASATSSAAIISLASLLFIFGPALYFITCWTNGGQTLGYRALGLKLVRTDGAPPGLGSAIARYIGVAMCMLMFIPGMVGLLWMLWDDKNQGWHDKLGDTVVVRT